jgi:hypothetical protein
MVADRLASVYRIIKKWQSARSPTAQETPPTSTSDHAFPDDKVRVIQDDTIHDLLPVHEIEVEPIRSTHRTDNPMFDHYIDM